MSWAGLRLDKFIDSNISKSCLFEIHLHELSLGGSYRSHNKKQSLNFCTNMKKISILDEHWSRKFLKNSKTEFRLNFFHWEVCKGRFFLQTNYSFKNRWGVLPNVYAILLPIKYILCVLLRNDLGSDITKLNHDGHSHGFCLWKWWHHYLFWQG